MESYNKWFIEDIQADYLFQPYIPKVREEIVSASSINSKTNATSTTCPLCSSSFPSMSALKEHFVWWGDVSFCRASLEANLPSVLLERVDSSVELIHPTVQLKEETDRTCDAKTSLEITTKKEDYYPVRLKNMPKIKIKEEKLHLGLTGDETEVEILDEKYYPGGADDPFEIEIKQEKFSPCSSDDESKVAIKDEDFSDFLDMDDSADVGEDSRSPVSFSEERSSDAGVPDLGQLMSVDITSETTPLLKSALTSDLESSERRFTCGICLRVYATKAILVEHRELKHPGATGAQCRRCMGSYKREEIYTEETHQCSSVRKFICPFCKKDYFYKTTLHSHIKNLHPEEVKLKCNKCSKKLISRQALVSHISKCEDTLFQCTLCDILFNCKSHLLEHIYANHKAGYQCVICLKKLRSLRGLSKHFKKCSAPEPKLSRHVCYICSKCYSARYTLLQHMRLKHPSAMTCECTYCSTTFLTGLDLEEHSRKCQATKRQYQCAVCPKEFTYKKSLDRHEIRAHAKMLA